MTNASAPAPGWYPDPERPGSTRWWDGSAWGPHAPVTTPPPAAPAAAQPATVQTTREPKRLGTAYLLGVFLIGSHRIYLGKIASGIILMALWYVGLFLLFFGVPTSLAWVPVAMMIAAAIWWIVDLARMGALVRTANQPI